MKLGEKIIAIVLLLILPFFVIMTYRDVFFREPGHFRTWGISVLFYLFCIPAVLISIPIFIDRFVSKLKNSKASNRKEGSMIGKECCEKLRPYAGLLLRLGLGIIFTYHGFGKVFGAGMSMGTAWNPNLPVLVQALVAWGEFLGGVAILLGFMTELAALGIIIIMLGAIVTVHAKNGFGMQNGGFEYNFLIIMACLSLIATGAGPLSIGCCGKGGGCCHKE